MERNNNSKKSLSRRKFLGSTAAVAAFSMMPVKLFGTGMPFVKDQAGSKPNSNFGSVQMGAITYSWRDQPGGIENIIKYCLSAGISSIELMSGDLGRVSRCTKESDDGNVCSASATRKSSCRDSCGKHLLHPASRTDAGTERHNCKVQAEMKSMAFSTANVKV